MLIQGIRARIGNKLILPDHNLEISKGVNLVLGQNGAGKTTLLRSIIRAFYERGGLITRGYVPAEFSAPEIQVRDVLVSGTRNNLASYAEYIQYFGLTNLLDRSFSSLSSGEKKLVLIAKALVEGDLVMMDEPTSGLDVKNQSKVMRTVTKLKGRKDFIIAVHDLNWLNQADRVILLKNGEIIWQSGPQELREDILEKLYEIRVKRVEIDEKTIFIFDL
ncbi:MAG: ABC transporter ATP-binding protein [Metallosphaera sp.]